MHKSHIHVQELFHIPPLLGQVLLGACLETGDIQPTGVSFYRLAGGDPLRSEVRPPQEVMPGHLGPCRPSISVLPPPPVQQHHEPGADKPTLGFPQAGHMPRHHPEAIPSQKSRNAAKTP